MKTCCALFRFVGLLSGLVFAPLLCKHQPKKECKVVKAKGQSPPWKGIMHMTHSIWVLHDETQFDSQEQEHRLLALI